MTAEHLRAALAVVFLTVMAALSLAAGATDQLRPGDKVIVSEEGAKLMMGKEVLAEFKKGATLQVTRVQGNWVGTKVLRGGKIISGWVSARSVTTVTASQTDGSDTVRIPSSVQGLWVNAICGRGCKPIDQKCDVYVFTPEEYKQRDSKSKDRSWKASPRGQTPLLVDDLPAGDYLVGVMATYDPEVVGKSPSPDGAYRIVNRYFADDVRDNSVTWKEFRVYDYGGVKAHTTHCASFWYSVKVEKTKLTPVVAVFLPADGTLEEWSKVYPSTRTFGLDLGDDGLNLLWDKLVELPLPPNKPIPPGTKRLLTDCLMRGGKVLYKLEDKFLTIEFNSDGQPVVQRRMSLKDGASKTGP